MRRSKVETAKTRERIVKAAGAEFLTNGITEAGLAAIMRAAGLTHGGFYRHFDSKNELVAEACGKILGSLIAGLESHLDGKPRNRALLLLVDRYVSRAHRDRPATGCPLAGLGTELARADRKTREAAEEGLLRLSRLIARQLEDVSPKKVEQESLAITAAMVGAIILARIAPDPRISNSILVGTREHIARAARRKR